MFEDSDYQGTVDPAGHPVTQTGAGNDELPEKGIFQVFSIGSFARWVRNIVNGEFVADATVAGGP